MVREDVLINYVCIIKYHERLCFKMAFLKTTKSSSLSILLSLLRSAN